MNTLLVDEMRAAADLVAERHGLTVDRMQIAKTGKSFTVVFASSTDLKLKDNRLQNAMRRQHVANSTYGDETGTWVLEDFVPRRPKFPWSIRNVTTNKLHKASTPYIHAKFGRSFDDV